MGVYAGPDVSESGLVLALDGANYKSFKGEATTNEIVSVTWSGDGSAQSGMSFGSSAVTEEYLKYNGYETYLWSPGTSLNCYLNGADLSASRTSTVWTFSCYVKREDGAAITSLNVYMYYPNSDGSAAGTIQNVGNGWYRVSRTRTGTNNYISLAGFTGFTAGYKYYLSGAQLEKKSYTTTVVATNTTRGTTVATGGGWADMSGNGNNGELQNGVRESSDNLGALVFDGVDDQVVSTSISLTDYTFDFFVKAVGDSLSGSTGYNTLAGYSGTRRLLYATSGSLLAQVGTGNINSSTTCPRNTWNHIAFSYQSSNTTATWYINGVNAGGSSASAQGTWSSTIYIGSYNSNNYWMNGNIAKVSIYNRALTAAEIQQNFNANRSRFGI